MGHLTKKKLVNATTIALKTATLAIPFPKAQVSLQAIIDMLREQILDVPAGFPMVEDTLSDVDEFVIIAVSDMIDDLDSQSEPLGATEKMVEEWLKKHGPYSDHEGRQITTAFFTYIEKVEIWAVQNPQILLKYIKVLLSELGRQGAAIDMQSNDLIEIRKWLQEVHKNIRSRFPSIEPSLYDYDKSNEEHFYNYFFADSSIAINEFFLLDNYRTTNLTEDCLELNSCAPDTNGCINSLDEILNIATNQGILLITGMYGTGKTALMKKLHSELKKSNGNLVYYFQAKDLIQFIEIFLLSGDGQDNKSQLKKWTGPLISFLITKAKCSFSLMN